jgi:hypothetical protein
MNLISEIIECPICMEVIEGNNNHVTTDCHHCFHTSCLMKSVAHNGFGCPYCRSKMAEDVESENDYDDDDSIEDDDRGFDDSALRGFRFFMNNIDGEEHDDIDIEDEEAEAEYTTNLPLPVEDKPSAALITRKLTEQGVTMEQLVKALLLNHVEYEHDYELTRVEGEVYGKMRRIILYQTIRNLDEEATTPRSIML